jgi:cytochrome bd-type quinol oxidase subunit 2
MDTPDTPLNNILGVVLIIIAFAIAYAYLKPHNLHKIRPVSTLLLKGSYLLYLLIMMIIIYISVLHKEGGIEAVFPDIEFFAFLVVLFAPSIGILARKLSQFRKKRENFNYFFTLVNALSILALLVMFFI